MSPKLPPVETLLPPFRQAALAAPLSAFPERWLLLHCRLCSNSVSYPLRLLEQRHGGGGTLGLVLARLRCQACQVPPAEVVLTDDPAAGAVGGKPATWRISLVPGVP